MRKQLLKIILCLTAVIFTVSCGGNNDSPTNPTQGGFTVNFESYPEPANKTIGTSSEKTSFTKEGKIKCYPSTEVKVEISKVTPVTASGSVSLEPTDFEVLTPTVSATENEIRIVLSASGIEKVKTAAAGELYEYTFSFLFTRTSDNKTATSETKLNVVNIDIINQTDIETAMKNVESGDAGKGNLVVSENPVWKFDLSKFALNKTSGFTATATSASGNVYVSNAESAIFSQAKGTGFYFTPKTVKDNDKKATLTITVKLNNNGYMLDDAVSYVATDGFKLVLKIEGDGTWKQL